MLAKKFTLILLFENNTKFKIGFRRWELLLPVFSRRNSDYCTKGQGQLHSPYGLLAAWGGTRQGPSLQDEKVSFVGGEGTTQNNQEDVRGKNKTSKNGKCTN